MRYVLALWIMVLLLSAGCRSPRTYTAAPALPPSAEVISLWQTTGPLRVGVEPYLDPVRQRRVFNADFRARNVQYRIEALLTGRENSFAVWLARGYRLFVARLRPDKPPGGFVGHLSGPWASPTSHLSAQR